jgi:hypothetical protein
MIDIIAARETELLAAAKARRCKVAGGAHGRAATFEFIGMPPRPDRMLGERGVKMIDGPGVFLLPRSCSLRLWLMAHGASLRCRRYCRSAWLCWKPTGLSTGSCNLERAATALRAAAKG